MNVYEAAQERMKVSNCCGVHGFISVFDGRLSGTNYYDSEQMEICPKCGEHCEYIEPEKENETVIKLY